MYGMQRREIDRASKRVRRGKAIVCDRRYTKEAEERRKRERGFKLPESAPKRESETEKKHHKLMQNKSWNSTTTKKNSEKRNRSDMIINIKKTVQGSTSTVSSRTSIVKRQVSHRSRKEKQKKKGRKGCEVSANARTHKKSEAED